MTRSGVDSGDLQLSAISETPKSAPVPDFPEEAQGRVVRLAPHESVSFDLAIEHFTGAAVGDERARIAASAAASPRIDPAPRGGWSRG